MLDTATIINCKRKILPKSDDEIMTDDGTKALKVPSPDSKFNGSVFDLNLNLNSFVGEFRMMPDGAKAEWRFLITWILINNKIDIKMLFDPRNMFRNLKKRVVPPRNNE